MKKRSLLSFAIVSFIAAAAVAATASVVLDLKPFEGTAETNPANRWDAVGLLHATIANQTIEAAVAARRTGDPRPPEELAAEAMDGIYDAYPGWTFSCVCVTEEGCPCKTLTDLFGPIDPEELGEMRSITVGAVLSEPVTRSRVLSAAATAFPSSDLALFTRRYDELRAAQNQLTRGTFTTPQFIDEVKRIESRITADRLSPSTRQALLATAATVRATVNLALAFAIEPAPALAKYDPLACAALGAAVIPAAPWLGALIGGGACLRANWQQEELCEMYPDECSAD